MQRYSVFHIILTILLSCASVSSWAGPTYDFENGVPAGVRVAGRGTAAVSLERYDDGKSSLKFSWQGQAELLFINPSLIAESMKTPNGGIMLWVYSEKPLDAPLRFTLKNASAKEVCHFDFNMNFKGWRACWIKYVDMKLPDDGWWGDMPAAQRITDAAMLSVRPSPMVPVGTIFIDRMDFSTKALNAQITPDMQLPQNNYHLSRRNMWHWARLWEWETEYPEVQPAPVGEKERKSVETAMANLTEAFENDWPGKNYDYAAYRPKLDAQFAKYHLERLSDGTVLGNPVVSNDEAGEGDMKIADAKDMACRYAFDFLRSGDKLARERFFLLIDNMIEHGFCYGSGMGTNHHYGYSITYLCNAMWLMRAEIEKEGKMDEYRSMLTYWSGISECRGKYEDGRDEIVDSWNTLLMPKVTAALMAPTAGEQYAYMRLVAEWTSESLRYTDGTIGGIKVDGTGFHHGGLYPAYCNGGFSIFSQYCEVVKDTEFGLSDAAAAHLKHALLTMRNYSNQLDWTIGIGGRHPYGPSTKIASKVVETMGRLALLGDQTGSGLSADPELGGAYLTLGGKNNAVKAALKKAGIQPSDAPEGFFVYNYGAMGIHRRGGWMLALKGFNTTVWGSEIYKVENRFGRYQSYGSVLLLGSSQPRGSASSGFVESGWDWNRLPGTTTIHLPFEILESPNPGTLMERNNSRFPGVSSLEGRNGVLAFTYVESDRKNFCAGATAVKSVFCFDNRIVFIGTGISNKSDYPTETTLFQQYMDSRSRDVEINGDYYANFPFLWRSPDNSKAVISDLHGNWFFVPDSRGLTVARQHQTSPDYKKVGFGNGDFTTAYINHGSSPDNAAYEYMMLIEPSGKDVTRFTKKLPYSVLHAGNDAHVVRDDVSGVTAWVSYSGYSADSKTAKPQKGVSSVEVVSVDAETIVMARDKGAEGVVMSVCTPDLGLTEVGYTVTQASQPLMRTVKLSGSWKLVPDSIDAGCSSFRLPLSERVKLSCGNGMTSITAVCLDGQPVEFRIVRNQL